MYRSNDDYYSILNTAAQKFDAGKLQSRFLNFFAHLDDTSEISLTKTVEAAFTGLDAGNIMVGAFRRAALNVAAKVDAGVDGTAKNAYHNPLHFSKVVFNIRALAALHNQMVDEGIVTGQPKLTDADIARGIFAAASHDVCHDARGNAPGGQHTPFRLERISVGMARSWAGISEKGLVEDGLLPIYGTDVTPPGQRSPARVVREWHDHYFKGGPKPEPISEEKKNTVPGYRELNSLTSSRSGILLASLLQDADVFCSAMGETEDPRVSAEMGVPVSPKGRLFFLNTILEGRMTTDVARVLADVFIASRRAVCEQESSFLLQQVQKHAEPGWAAPGDVSSPARSARHPAEGTQAKSGKDIN